MIKILYFDTNAIIKYFVPEKGSNLIKWVVNNYVSESITIHTSQIALYEFKPVLKKIKERGGGITAEQFKRIIFLSKGYLPIFRVIDDHKVPGFKKGKDMSYLEICTKHMLNIKKDGWDARHLSCVINYLRCYGGASKPRIITADTMFSKIIKAEGYDVINPEKVTREDFLSIINN